MNAYFLRDCVHNNNSTLRGVIQSTNSRRFSSLFLLESNYAIHPHQPVNCGEYAFFACPPWTILRDPDNLRSASEFAYIPDTRPFRDQLQKSPALHWVVNRTESHRKYIVACLIACNIAVRFSRLLLKRSRRVFWRPVAGTLDKTPFATLGLVGAAESSSAVDDRRAHHMEHSYSRGGGGAWRPPHGAHIMTTRTIMVHRPPPCPSCHAHPAADGDTAAAATPVDPHESHNPPIPMYDEASAREAMLHTQRLVDGLPPTALANAQPDADWEQTVSHSNWTVEQETLFADVVRILDNDRLARLANEGRQHEPVLRRAVIDKTVARLCRALAKQSWQPTLTQWLHALLVDRLPSTYMCAYLDALQTLRKRIGPELVDAMMRLRPATGGACAALLAPVLQPAWEPCVEHKRQRLPGVAPVIVVAPERPLLPDQQPTASGRQQRWLTLLGTMATVVPVHASLAGLPERASIYAILEHMVAVTRARIQELRNEVVGRHIVLVGFNAGAALAIQVAMAELLTAVVCLSFPYHTLDGPRGEPDDKMLEIGTPVLFVQGQNSAWASQEEMEALRERMVAQTSLVVVGSADEALRVGKTKRQIEGVTQTMVDSMIVDEVAQFAAACIVNPPAPRDLCAEQAANARLGGGSGAGGSAQALGSGVAGQAKKRKVSASVDDGVAGLSGAAIAAPKPAKQMRPVEAQPKQPPRKVGRPRTVNQPSLVPVASASPGAVNATPTPAKAVLQAQPVPISQSGHSAVQSVPPASATIGADPLAGVEILSTFEVQPNMVLKPIQTALPLPGAGPSTLAPLRKAPLLNAGQILLAPSPPAAFQPQQAPRIVAPLPGQLPGALLAGPAAGSPAAGLVGTASTMQKIKMLPGNQFVKIKPPALHTSQKLYTLNPSGGATTIGPLNAAAKSSAPLYTVRTPVAVGAAAPLPTLVGSSPQPVQMFDAGGGTSTVKMSKVYTVKSTPTGTQLLSSTGETTSGGIGATMKPAGFTLGGKQVLLSGPANSTAVANAGAMLLSPKKYTLIKPQQPQPAAATGKLLATPKIIKLSSLSGASPTAATAADLNDANIFDMPILFADSDGNIQSPPHEQLLGAPPTTPVQPPPPPLAGTPTGRLPLVQTPHRIASSIASPAGTIVLNSSNAISSGTGTTNRNIIINTIGSRTISAAGSVTGAGGGNKVVLIQRPSLRPVAPMGGNFTVLPAPIGSQPHSPQQPQLVAMQKFTKVNVSNASSISLPVRTGNLDALRPAGATVAPLATSLGPFKPGTTFTLAGSAMLKPQTQQPQQQQHFVVATSATGRFAPASPSVTATAGGAPMLLNVDADKTTINKIIKLGDTQIKPSSNTIVLKPGMFRPMMKPGILNRNVTVRKLNLIPSAAMVGRPSTTSAVTSAGVSPGMHIVLGSAAPPTPVAGSPAVVMAPHRAATSTSPAAAGRPASAGVSPQMAAQRDA